MKRTRHVREQDYDHWWHCDRDEVIGMAIPYSKPVDSGEWLKSGQNVAHT